MRNPFKFIFSLCVVLTVFGGAYATGQWPKLRFEFNKESQFSFNLEVSNEKKLVACNGTVFLKYLKDKINIRFGDVNYERDININIEEVNKILADPIVVPMRSGAPVDLDGMSDWERVDPRIVIKVLKYFLYNDGNPVEFGWESEDFLCDVEIQHSQERGMQVFDAQYDLKRCLQQNDVGLHIRQFRALHNSLNINNIEYFYQLTKGKLIAQSQVWLDFVGFKNS